MNPLPFIWLSVTLSKLQPVNYNQCVLLKVITFLYKIDIQALPVMSCLLSSVAYAFKRLENIEIGVNPEARAPTAAEGKTSDKRSCLLLGTCS